MPGTRVGELPISFITQTCRNLPIIRIDRGTSEEHFHELVSLRRQEFAYIELWDPRKFYIYINEGV